MPRSLTCALLLLSAAHAWVLHSGTRITVRRAAGAAEHDDSEDEKKNWLAMSVEERKAWKVARDGPRTSRYSAQAMIAQRFPDGIPEYTGPKPDDVDEDCLIFGVDGQPSIDP